MEVRVLRTPMRSPEANAICDRLVGTMRRECLDFFIPVGERHLRQVLRIWITHYNQSSPHMSLGPGIPASLLHRPCLPADHIVRSKPVLGGLHHEYWAGEGSCLRFGCDFCGGQPPFSWLGRILYLWFSEIPIWLIKWGLRTFRQLAVCRVIRIARVWFVVIPKQRGLASRNHRSPPSTRCHATVGQEA